MINLTKQVAMVTGGSRGIGRAAAILLAMAGADIVILYRKNSVAASKTKQLIKTLGVNCNSVRIKVEKIEDCKKVVDNIRRKYGRIDILVNSAGIWEEGKIGEISAESWHRSIDINLTGTFNMCNTVVPHMKARKYGRIVNISSTAGQRGEAFHSPYAASKGGIIAFTKSIAPELIKYNIWVNCVAPGWVETEMTSGAIKNQKSKKEILKTIPRGVISTPEEIAGPILFLASHLADSVVGEVLNVNGGSVLCG
jgi:3-oxoacyl-[acyl-carrier protein] reductase